MSTQTPIEWTDMSWNPLVGCTRVSQGCVHCYAETMAARIANASQEALRRGKTLTDTQEAYREVVRWEMGGDYPYGDGDKALPKWNNEIRLLPSVLTDPLRWTKPRRVFVNSMTDLFHEKVPFDYIDRVFAVMALTPQHTYQVLTKRPERMAEYLLSGNGGLTRAQLIGLAAKEFDQSFEGCAFPLKNAWLGTSVEDQKAADERIPHLLRCPGTLFLSCEPLLGDLNIKRYLRCTECGPGWRGWDRPWQGPSVARNLCPVCQGYPEQSIDWVIAGGESGPGARPMHPDWPRSLRDQCQAAGVPFFFKQWGAYAESCQIASPYPDFPGQAEWTPTDSGRSMLHIRTGKIMVRVGKHEAGRILDGRTWDQMPEASK